MAKSMRVNRNKRYSKKRNNNKVTNKKSARRASKRHSRRNNKRTLRGGIRGGAENRENKTVETKGTVVGTEPKPEPEPEPIYEQAVQGFSNPLYAAIKDQTDKTKAVAELVTKITDVIKLLESRIKTQGVNLKLDISTDEKLLGAIDEALKHVDDNAQEDALEGEYKDADLTALRALLNELKALKIGEYGNPKVHLEKIQELINGLGVFAASYNYNSQKELNEFRAKVEESRKTPKDLYINVKTALEGQGVKGFSNPEDIYIEIESTSTSEAAQEPEPAAEEPRPENTLVDGTLVRVIKEGNSYRAQIVKEPE